MKSIGIYKRKKQYIFSVRSETTTGLFIAIGVNKIIGVDETNEKIGEIILELLEYSETGIPHPNDWSEYNEKVSKPFLKMLGARNWNEFNKRTLQCAFPASASIPQFGPKPRDH